MQLRILAVGRLKERHLAALCAEYQKRLRRFARVRVDEVRDARGVAPELAREREAEALSRQIESGATVVALTREGRSLSSTDLADWLEGEANAGRPRLTFCIGGPMGLAPSLIERADARLSLSAMTLTHEMARLLLLEQLYRAMTIWRGEPYHKGG